MIRSRGNRGIGRSRDKPLERGDEEEASRLRIRKGLTLLSGLTFPSGVLFVEWLHLHQKVYSTSKSEQRNLDCNYSALVQMTGPTIGDGQSFDLGNLGYAH